MTNFVSESALEVNLTLADLNGGGVGRIAVFNTAPGGGTSGTLTVPIGTPLPTLTALSANKAKAGDPDLQITLTGTGFVTGSAVRFGPNVLPSTLISYTQLQATIAASQMTAGIVRPLSVSNPSVGGTGGVSPSIDFTVENPVPTLSSVSPDSAVTGDQITITVTGRGFIDATAVRANGSNRLTTKLSATQATVLIPAFDLTAAGTLSLTAFNPAPGGGESLPVTLRVRAVRPHITELSPSSVVAGQPGFALVVTGTDFPLTSSVQWNGQARSTQVVSSTRLTATIPASDIATPTIAQVTVFDFKRGVSSAPATLPVVLGSGPPIVGP